MDLHARDFRIQQSSPRPLSLTCQEPGGHQERHQRLVPAADAQTVTLRGFKAETAYQCHVSTLPEPHRPSPPWQSPPLSFTTASLPYDLKAPTITVPTTDLARTGYILYSYGVLRYPWRIDNRYQVILDAEGNIRWYFAGDGGGDTDTTWLKPDAVLYGGYHSYSIPPTIVGLDKTIRFKDTSRGVEAEEKGKSWNHDAGISEDGQSIFYLTIENNGTYNGFVIRQIDVITDAVLWTWSSFEDGRDKGYLPAGSADNDDPYHANAIDDQWENGRLYLYVGLRDQNQVIKIDYETGEVLWHLGVGGDFTLLEKNGSVAQPSRWFFDPHDIKFYGPTLMSVHDNGTERTEYGASDYSRALQLDVDQNTMTARIRFEYTEPSWKEPIWGGYDLLPTGNSLLAIAHCWQCAPERVSSLLELGPDARVLWRADFTTDNEHAYRAERIDGCEIFNNTDYCHPSLPPVATSASP